MAKTVWQDTLEALRKDPSYSGMFHMMEKFGDDTAAEVSDKNDNVVKGTYREYIDMSLAACGVMEKKMIWVPGACFSVSAMILLR